MMWAFVALSYFNAAPIFLRRISGKTAIFQYLLNMMIMSFSGQPKSGKETPRPDFPPADMKPALPNTADPEDPLEPEAEDVMPLDETLTIVPDDEPPAPGEGP